ncbi:MAG TPA: glycoside hydrolase family 25 protein, partial [Anaerovoracaceae bacterium]|nr:glycoside hydrolase family 25 protein [Anaerovoracaceae bacterium]
MGNTCRKKSSRKRKASGGAFAAWLKVMGALALLAVLIIMLVFVFGNRDNGTALNTELIEYEGDIRSYDDGDIRSISGVDVSTYQREIDWSKVREQGISFAMIRCGYRTHEEGILNEDDMFKTNLQGALDVGLDVGVYFYSQAVTEEEAKEEADYVIDLIKNYSIVYPVAFDMEYTYDDERIKALSSEELTEVAKAFCKRIERAGYEPMIYGNHTWLTEHVNLNELDKYDIWIADYSDNLTFPNRVKMWQYTNEGRVSGIPTNVDLNMFLLYN